MKKKSTGNRKVADQLENIVNAAECNLFNHEFKQLLLQAADYLRISQDMIDTLLSQKSKQN